MSRPDRAGSMRALLARFVAVVAVIAGLLVLIVPLCGDGMSAMSLRGDSSPSDPAVVPSGSVLMPAMSSGVCGVAGVDPGVEECSSATSNLLPASGSSMPGSGGLLLACIVFLVAVLVAGLGLRPPFAGRVAAAQSSAVRDRLLAGAVRQLTLAELCVLRT